MVDWDRVEELRSKGTEWSKIAVDPKVGFHADESAGDPGRALRALYHRSKARGRRKPQTPTTPRPGSAAGESRWTLIRIGFLAVPLVAIWFLIAYLVPSPVGLLVPAIPYLGLVLAVVAFVFVFALWRSTGRRWSAVYRSTLIGGIVLGLVVAGLIGLAGSLLFGCPYLPPASSLTSEPDNWEVGHMAPWQDNGKPILYSYGSTWCPFCSASSWAFYKALTQFGSVSGAVFTDYSSSTDVDPSTPEVVLAGIQLSSTTISFQVSEDTSGVEGTSPATTSCFQLAYVAAYGGGSIPFGVVNGQYVHAGASFVNPADLKNYQLTGDQTVKGSVLNETGTPWTAIQGGTWWIMTYLAKATGLSIGKLSNWPGASKWSAATISAVESDMNQTS
ncbi:MAG: DUF929 family protein [Thermoplasmata archaeon]|nr:DUF929 family protein [Thermoplasmata archaeon]